MILLLPINDPWARFPVVPCFFMVAMFLPQLSAFAVAIATCPQVEGVVVWKGNLPSQDPPSDYPGNADSWYENDWAMEAARPIALQIADSLRASGTYDQRNPLFMDDHVWTIGFKIGDLRGTLFVQWSPAEGYPADAFCNQFRLAARIGNLKCRKAFAGKLFPRLEQDLRFEIERVIVQIDAAAGWMDRTGYYGRAGTPTTTSGTRKDDIMSDLAKKIAATTGLGVNEVSQVLAALPQLAYASGTEGFVLPGFGKFKVVPGAERQGRNPITGKAVVLRAPPVVEFTIDTDARMAFVAGGAKAPDQITQTLAPKVLPAIKLTVDAEDARAAGIDVTKAGKCKCRIGGKPDWIQAPQVPVCCGEPMLFYGQLDSLGGDHCLGDMGMLYAFFCRSCSSGSAVMQC